jgi:hypothetical protein
MVLFHLNRRLISFFCITHLDKHEHGHEHPNEHKIDDVPAWKKNAMEEEGDVTVAPFGGTWTTESNVSASGKVEEEGDIAVAPFRST